MPQLDHLIVRVSDPQRSARFYEQLLGFAHEGNGGPFEIVRVNEATTLDLLGEPPKDAMHLAFTLDRASFEGVRARLQARGIAYGGHPFTRDGHSAPQQGARGWADSLYFHDPDQHNIEVRTHDDV
ncbi:Catechol 2,3-dioxygenase [Andreprevotia lacus DSM 23236]|jgi:catechol 2,3-dioxygenase-like lactoylglutathione lyase family enzyme|uniref:Catechol 2,3-dioxygenase n=1 Tax=Andreprevotia lacus DSM 23236 TaxID=1121001 RepID=A0A1W1X8W9_9NEIS|nr:VOC family protein [Andreprevotia lacus]SMC20425.1 Catechol 2,3-dioxygenase [Andreprevotia lacus DSM 23236]